MRYFYFFFSCVLLVLLTTSYVSASAPYNVTRGERPPIRWEEVQRSDYDHGILLIKFSEELGRHLEEHIVDLDEDGIVRFHVENVDLLNAAYGVRGVQQYFLSPALNNEFTARHRAWGFHLWYRLEVDERTDIVEMLLDYKRLPEIEIAEPSFRKELIGSHDINDFHVVEPVRSDNGWIPNDPQFGSQWHYHNTGQQNGTPGVDISLPAAWDIEKGDSTIVILVIDGGIDYNHQDLAGNMWYQIGYNFVHNSTVIEPHNHGTHVAGTVAAVNNNNIGVSGVAGGSGADDGVRLMSAQVFAASGNGGFHLAPLYGADNGASISQNSWGYTSPNYYEQNVLDAIDYFNENGGGDAMEGGITIFSAGNSNTSDPRYPGYYSGAYSVAATNNQDQKAWYSTFGEWVDISAPGGETNTVTQRGVLSTLNNNSYGYYQGTSMASPHVSGVAALMLSRVFGELAAEDVADILTMTVDNHYHVNPGFLGQLGSGRLNALEALILAELFLILPSNPSNFTATGITDTEISLSWEKNDDNDEVMVAWSPDGSFGAPEEGVTYEAGDELPGGGHVLYVGEETTFLHDGLNASTLYFYRSWSIDDDGVYSYGRNTDGRTLCGIEELPVSEAFGGGDVPYCWDFDPSQGNWRASGSYGNPAPAMIFNWSPSITNYSHRLVSPPYNGDIPGSAIALEFDMMLDNYSANTTENLSIEVFDGTEWHEVIAFNNNSGDIAWDTYMVDITPYAIDNVFMIGFRAHGSNSFNLNRWVIDNFHVYSYSCAPPYELAADNITVNSAEISWVSVGEETQWDLLWGPQGFDPISAGTLVGGIEETSYLLEGLDVFTNYDVYVRADCGDDDISIWAGPVHFKTLATCPAPIDLHVGEITSSSALVSWTPVGDEDLWDIVYGESGFPPETGGELIQGIAAHSFLLEGLSPVTQYDVYVRAYCGENDESIWTGPATFTTPCDIFTLPYSENFHGASPDCWEFPDGQGNWSFGSNYAPPSSVSGPPHAVFSWSPSVTSYSFSLVSPQIDATNQTETILMDYILFLNNFNDANINQMAVEYKALASDEWILLENFSSSGLGGGNQENVIEGQVLPGMAGQIFQVRFRAYGENSFSINGWSVDDIHIYTGTEPEPCYPPTALTADEITNVSAMLNWQTGGSETEWDLTYGTPGFNPENEGTTVNGITQKPYTLTGLEHNTDYSFHVRAVCGDTHSDWSDPAPFTTELNTYIVHATAGEHGSIDPEGEIEVVHGEDILFYFYPQNHHHIADVSLDGASVMDQIEMIDGPLGEGHYHMMEVINDHALHVDFAVNIYHIDVTVDPIEGGTVNGYGDYPYGTEVSLVAEAATEFLFLHWKEDGEVVHDEAQYTFFVDGDRALSAHFQSTVATEDLPGGISGISVYPNPADNHVWVSFYNNHGSDVRIMLLNLQGQQVIEKLVSDAGAQSVKFGLEGLNGGVYIIQVEAGGSMHHHKVIVQ